MKKFLLIICVVATFGYVKAQSVPGTLDTSFGNNGTVVESIYNFEALTTGEPTVVIQSDGKILTATHRLMFTKERGLLSELLVMRHNPDGTIDPTYGDNGYAFIAPRDIRYFCWNCELVEDDNLILVGYTYDPAESGNLFMTKLDNNGNVVTSFGVNGYVVYENNGTMNIRNSVMQPDGKILLVGTYNDNFCILRYLPNGQLDPSFADNGTFVHTLYFEGGFLPAYGECIDVDAEGNIYAGGWYVWNDGIYLSQYDCEMLCLDKDGNLNPNFGDNGLLQFPIGEVADFIIGLEVLDDGKILFFGHTETFVEEEGQGAMYNIYVGKMFPDGSFDGEFGDNGISIEHYVEDFAHYGRKMTVADNGEVFVGGFRFGNTKDLFIVNFLADGSLNEDFGHEGIFINEVPGHFTAATDVTIQSDGKLVFVGSHEDAPDYIDYYLGRIHTDFEGVGINENETVNVVSVYPNPAVDEVRFDGIQDKCIANVYDMSGRLVMRSVVMSDGVMNVSKLAAGNYSVMLVSGDEVFKARFVK